MDSKKITIRSENGRSFVHIDREKFELMSRFIMENLSTRKELSLQLLLSEAQLKLQHDLQPQEIGWLLVKVKSALEGKKLIAKKWEPGCVQMVKITRRGLQRYRWKSEMMDVVV